MYMVSFSVQLAQCCDRQMELEKQIDNPDKDRIRYIEGKDLGPVELQRKIDDVRAVSLALFQRWEFFPSVSNIIIDFVLFLPRDALSAKRGLAIACRPSVRPSVCLSVRL